ncbi:MAG: cyclic nucleotide-binding/CBS domain-containing protein [Nitrospirae bacterium]|nr:cyclic nucleotide-binding/CBS domain-containing protein [Nitrospirota bacterium]
MPLTINPPGKKIEQGDPARIMILEEAINFLKNNPPFHLLEEPVLKDVARSLSMEFYPRGSVILKQDGPPSEAVRIIKKGSVKILMRTEGEMDSVIDFRGEGDSFGFVSLVAGDRQKTTVIAADDSVCYILGRDRALRLIEANPAVAEFFMSHLTRFVDRTFEEMRGRRLSYSGTDRLLFTTPAGDIAKEVITVSEDTTIQEAARVMTAHSISSLIILNGSNVPAGIVTDRDLRKVVANARSLTEPVKYIMSISLIRVDAGDSCFEAIMKMIRYNIHHMLVIKDGELKGIITNHDLLLLQGTSPLSFVTDIEKQKTVEGLAPVCAKMNNIIGLLIQEGAKAGSVTGIITEINDRLLKKVIEIAEEEFGHPPVPYCFIVFGSEGRKEQTFKTDQDNAVIYADTSSAVAKEEAKRYFGALTVFINDSLAQTGFPSCPADFMANNPKWCQPLGSWKDYFEKWITRPMPDAVLKSLIFFDMRPVYGKFSLCDELRSFYFQLLAKNKIFLGHMANMIVRNSPPIGFFKSFVVEKSGEHKNEFDLKLRGVMPLNDIVRLFALESGVKLTTTLDRISALKARHPVVREYHDEIVHVFELIMMLRMHCQYEQIKEGRSPGNFINPDRLSNLEKKSVREAFHLISKLQGMVVEMYKPLIV